MGYSCGLRENEIRELTIKCYSIILSNRVKKEEGRNKKEIRLGFGDVVF